MSVNWSWRKATARLVSRLRRRPLSPIHLHCKWYLLQNIRQWELFKGMQWAIRGKGVNWKIISGQQTHNQSVPETPSVPKRFPTERDYFRKTSTCDFHDKCNQICNSCFEIKIWSEIQTVELTRIPGISEHVLRTLKYRASRFYTQNPIVTGHLVACHRHYTQKKRSTVVIKTNSAFSEIPCFM